MIDVESYARNLEAYLSKKNDGHLIRITGPAFEQVQGWAIQGVPLKVAEAGIDRYFERYYRKGPRRRPVRIEFCEADVLDAFDDWRRAVGVTNIAPDAAGGPDVEDPQPATRGRRSLGAQIESALARLTVLRGSDKAGPKLGAALDAAVRALDALRPEAASARGHARDQLLLRTSEIEAALMVATFEALEAAERAALNREADAELEPFRGRMPEQAYQQALRQAQWLVVRRHFGLPEFP
ncbi:MAG: hypothetical protein K2Y23_09645 [Cyanobacteria bacterium]|nr:hypothetical protein [Cyanobacteriota bacterium]